MKSLFFLALLAAHYGASPDLRPNEVEARAIGGLKPAAKVDPALSLAARELAALSQRQSLQAAVDAETIRLALARSGGVAAELVPVAVQANDVAAAVERLVARMGTLPPAARIGIGASRKEESIALVALLAEERVKLEPFPSKVERGAVHPLRGSVLPPLRGVQVIVTPPGGRPVRLPSGPKAPRFASAIAFEKRGRHTVEVVGHGPDGPQVAAILEVWAGEEIPEAPKATDGPREPEDVAGKERFVAGQVDALRRAKGLRPLALDPALGRIARAYAEELLRSGRFSHVSPESGDLKARLRRGKYAWSRAAENLAQAPTALGAHRSTVDSPGHLGNLLGDFTHAGYGVAMGPGPGGAPTVIVVEIFATPQ